MNTKVWIPAILCLLCLTVEAQAQKTLRMKFVQGAKSTISLVNKTTVDTEFVPVQTISHHS